MIFSTVTSLPWSLYSTFVIEQRHGFNKQVIVSDVWRCVVIVRASQLWWGRSDFDCQPLQCYMTSLGKLHADCLDTRTSCDPMLDVKYWILLILPSHVYVVHYSAPVGVQSIVINPSVCLSVCLCTCLSVCLCVCLSTSISLEPLDWSPQNFVHRLPVVVALAALCYIMYFWFYGWRHVWP